MNLRHFRRLARLIPCMGVVLALVLSGCMTSRTGPPVEPVYANATERAQFQTATLEQVWRMVNRRFYDPDFNGADWATALERYRNRAAGAPNQEALYAVINEMLDELGDGHTGALTPREAWADFRAERAFVGINLERIEDQWVVSELRPGSAAHESEIEPGWIALSRDGEPLPESRLNLESHAGNAYTWEFLDANDEERAVTLEARTLPDWMPPQEWHDPEGWVYLRFDEFEAEYHKWLRERLKLHRDAPGIVLDLRNNAGGAVSSLEFVINDFFPERVSYGAFVSRKGKRDHEKSAWFDGVGYAGPLVVLIGGGSASSAEILAHVFQHYGRATLVGRSTAGLVIASRLFRLRDGGELQIGMQDFETLDGSRLEGNGVQPDVVVERTLRDLREGYDADLTAAVKWLRANARPAIHAEM
jgi:carboxyl-terminal processing protease